jgi:hypothetical protein
VTYQQLKELDPPELIYDSEGKISEIHYLDSVNPPSVVVHYEHGNALQHDINNAIICYYHDVEVTQDEITWFLARNSQK